MFKIRMTLGEIIYVIISLIIMCLCALEAIPSYSIVMYILILVFCWIFIMTLSHENFSLYQIFLITFFVFLLGRVFLNCLGLYDLRTLEMLQHTMMDETTALTTLNTLTVYLIGTSFAWLQVKHTPDKIYFSQPVDKPGLNKIIQKLYFIYIVLFITKLAYFILAIRKYGYLAIFNGTVSSNINYPIIFTGAAQITEILFSILLFYNRDIKSFKINSGLLLLAGMVKMLTGQRAYGFVLLLYIIYLWSTYYKEIKIINYRMILLALFTPILIQVIWNFRYNVENNLFNIIGNNLYFSTLQSQGASLEVVAGTISLGDKFQNNVPFLLGYFVDFFSGSPTVQNISAIKNGNYLGYQLTYAINSAAFLSGRGTGTSFVAEIYSTFNGNLFLVALVGYISTLIVLYVAKKAYKNLYIYGVSFYLLTDFIFSPRHSILKNIASVVAVIGAVFAFSIIEKTVKK